MTYTPAIGDFLVRPKAGGLVKHVGVLIAPNNVLQNTPEKGEHLATVNEFAAGAPVTVLPTGAQPAHVMARARQILARAKAYHPLARNCEHTATETVGGVAKSPQLLFFAAFAVIITLLVIFWPRR
jgi:hypothetical protein